MNEPIFYLEGKTIHKRPTTSIFAGGERIKCGFPICTVSEFVDEKAVLELFNNHTE